MERFLALHQDHLVIKHQWVLGGSMLRAFTESGRTATISRTELELLVDAGLMRRGVGYSVHLTPSQEKEVAA